MKKTLLTLTLALTSLFGYSQYIYHSVDECKTLTNVTTSENITYTVSVANPDTTNPIAEPNTSTNVSRIETTSNNASLLYALPNPIAVGTSFSLSMRIYSATEGGNGSGSGRVVVRLFNSVKGTGNGNRVNLFTSTKTAGEWVTLSYPATVLPDNTDEDIDSNGGYDRLLIIPVNNPEDKNDLSNVSPLFIDDIQLNIEPTAPTVLADDTADLDTDHLWFYDNSPDAFNATISNTGGAMYEEAQATPTTDGNSSPTVLKITRGDDSANSGIVFLGHKFDYTTGNLKFRIYPECNPNATSNVRIRVRINGAEDTSEQISFASIDLVENIWNEVTIDLSSVTPNPVAPNNVYDTFVFLFNQGDATAASNGAVFYVDAVQAPKVALLSTNDIKIQDEELSVSPNPVNNSFQLNTQNALESVQVFGINGSLLKTFDTAASYDISDLDAGVYFVSGNSAKGTNTVKIVKK
ncbi:T9SS type A sorting domain-containing protein [Flavicella sediminum]|uniref:T9SS type A sorting domain-containing protein n=1 Tax=Flavicella sediminum TaxID=2585141 RepID=UPI00111EB093|nr:T9SS type A sorting domain-containing protein [Flavicella sediminum]